MLKKKRHQAVVNTPGLAHLANTAPEARTQNAKA